LRASDQHVPHEPISESRVQSAEGVARGATNRVTGAFDTRERFAFLDGLRGWGAVVVVVFHYWVQVFPLSPEAARVLQQVIFLNGTIAVWVFFVVSGFALSIGYIRRQDGRALARLAVGRYTRLAIPIFIACSLVHLMMVSGWIVPSSERPDALKPFLNFDSSLSRLLRFSFLDVFFDFRLVDSYIPPLWTMSIELMGSAVVIGLVAAFGRLEWRVWVYVSAMIALMALNSLYGLFIAGMILAELYVRGVSDAPGVRSLLVGGFVVGLLVPILFSGNASPAAMFGIVAWCAAWMFLMPLRRLLELPVSRWLGRCSFPLYLIHAPLLYSLSLLLLRRFEAAGISQPTANSLVVAVSVPLAVLAAWLLTPVNDVAIELSRWLGHVAVDRWTGSKVRSESSPVVIR
jgi:peptidoglycan/LPS O-acetylase OafA/YrhL